MGIICIFLFNLASTIYVYRERKVIFHTLNLVDLSGSCVLHSFDLQFQLVYIPLYHLKFRYKFVHEITVSTDPLDPTLHHCSQETLF